MYMDNKKNNKALDHKCPSCMAPIFFNPKLGKWKCEYCNSEFTLEELKKFNNASSKEANDTKNADDTIYDSYKCENCGAEIIADENTASTFCLYCGNTAILKSKLSGKFSPTKIIPFKKVKEDAVTEFKNLKRKRPLLPRQFVSVTNIEKITGLYIPFWLYNILVTGEMNAIGKKIKSWTVGDRHYTKTDIYDVKRAGSMLYKLIPVDGSKRFDDNIMNTIEPFDYNELIDYNHAYLSGFLAEKYDFENEEAIKIADKRAINSTSSEMKKSIHGYSSVSVKLSNFNSEEQSHEYALLPVWMVNVKYKGKYYLFAMNGQTGRFIGDMPIDKLKALFLTIIIFVINALIFILSSYIIYKMGV